MAAPGAPVDRDPELEERLRQYQQEYFDFLDDERDEGMYNSRVKDLIKDGETRLIVSINHLRQKLPDRAKGLLESGFEDILCFERALKEVISLIDVEYAKQREEFTIGFEGSFGQRHVTPRTLKSRYIGNMVCCEGIATKCSLVRPKVSRSVHYCAATNKTVERRYADMTSYEAFPTGSSYPTEDENKNPLETEYGLCLYRDHQTITIQEMPENAPTGQLPRSVDIVTEDDLVDRCKPGDRIRVVGMYRCLPSKRSGYSTGIFRTIVIANNIQLLSKEASPNFSQKDISNIKKFARQHGGDVFETLSRSLAPSIHGHSFVKQAILSVLLGGTEKVLANGTRLRGDINVLLIGDPSVAKSQLLRYVLHTAPRAIPTTGRGSSGVGLTAAVTSDPDTGDRRLEAGAMVLADRGIVCIDEFDKMTDIDRTAIHEVMEQGRVTIAKAGIHAKLNARCAVLAAANPVYGRYDQSKDPMSNIGMQDSLLSRFDLIMILLDKHNEDRDAAIADHVLCIHRYRNPGEEDGAVIQMGNDLQTLSTDNDEADDARSDDNTSIWEQGRSWIPQSGKSEKHVNMDFMRKYIHVAKSTRPVLTKQAASFIAQQYTELRQSEAQKGEKEKTTPVTARTLETMIRLATARAKARLSKQVLEEDARMAYDLLHYACFKEVPKRVAEKKRRREPADSDEEAENLAPRTKKEKKKKEGKEGDTDEEDVYEFDDDTDSDVFAYRSMRAQRKDLGDQAGEPSPDVPAISIDRYKAFQRHLRAVFDEKGAEALPVDEVVRMIQERAGPAVSQFADLEVRAALERLGDDNAAMISDGTMILI